MSSIPSDQSPTAYAYPLLIKQLLLGVPVHAEQEIVYRDSLRYRYRDLRQRIGRLASALAGLGVAPGDTVAMMDWDSHRYLECFFAVPMMGAVLQTVNVRLSNEQILYTLNHAGASVVIVHADFLPVLAAIKDKLETVRRFVLIEEGGPAADAGIAFAGAYEALLAAAAPDYDFPDFDENTRATTFYTTGTTGLPKGVYFSHRQLVLHTIVELAALSMPARQGRFHAEDVYMPLTPMFHVHAWGIPYVATVMGVKQVYPGRYLPDLLLRQIKAEGVTFSHCVPTILHMLLNHPASPEVDLSRWKVIIGGSALPRALAQQALGRGIDVFTGYGMSETCPLLTLAQVPSGLLAAAGDDGLDLRVKTGRPVPLVDLRIVDPEMRDAPHDGSATGEIVLRTPWLTQGYVKNAEASAQLWAGGYLHTNDIGKIDAQGYLTITDRIKDVIKTGGEWLSSIELEDIIAQHPAVSEVAVIAVKDARWGERPFPLIVAKAGRAGEVTADTVKRHVTAYVERGIISKYAVPERVLVVDALARTSVGKLDKKAMREKYAV
ncbi:MAG TPA: fatty acid--CoA ligase [Stellaceae bacterium]|nr:fatty acid--CoA ligase [Stellaceae bacterium]